MTYQDLIQHGLRVVTDSAGRALWQDALGYRDEGPTVAFAVRLAWRMDEARGPFGNVAVRPRVVFAEDEDTALSSALKTADGWATAEIIAGPVPVPDVDEAVFTGLQHSLR